MANSIHRARIFTLAAAIVALLFSNAASAGPGFWTSAGPEGGAIADMVRAPSDPTRIYLINNRVLFRSDDGGLTWQMLDNGLLGFFPIRVAVHPLDQDSLWIAGVGGTRLLGSSDGGMSWTAIGTGLGDVFVTSMHVVPVSPAVLYATTSSEGLFRSVDAGASFTRVAELDLPAHLLQVVVDPDDPLRVLVRANFDLSSPPALYRSVDGGVNFAPVAPVWPEPVAGGQVAFSGNVAGELFAGFDSHMYRSTDSGASFTAMGSTGVFIGSLATVPGTAGHLYVGNMQGAGIRFSSDSGVTWSDRNGGLSANGVDTAEIRAVSPRSGGSEIVAASLTGGAFRSVDGGISWTAVNQGLRSVNVRAVAVHPTNPDVILAGYGDSSTSTVALHRSDDGGATWNASSAGLEAESIRHLLIDPNTAASVASTHIYAVGSDFAPQPISARRAGLYKSVDGGSTWTTIDNLVPMPAAGSWQLATVRWILADPTSGSAGGSGPLQTLLVSNSGIASGNCTALPPVPITHSVARMWRSVDAGSSWQPWDALPQGECAPGAVSPQDGAFIRPLQFAMDPVDPDTLYVGTFLSFCDDCPGYTPAVPNGIFKSVDGGASWTHSSTGIPHLDGPGSSQYDVYAVTVDPADGNILYAAVQRPQFSGPGNVYKSTDAGASWFPSGVGIAGADVRFLLVDPNDSQRVYAASGGSLTDPGGVYISDDGGLSWNSASIALPASAATSLAIDDTDPVEPTIHAGTVQGAFSLTRVSDLDGDGPPDTVEASAPFGGDGNEDGEPDSEQSNVASMGDAGDARGVEGARITITSTGVSGDCTAINDAHALQERGLITDSGHRYPLGVVRFELLDCQQAIVSVRYHGEQFGSFHAWRRFGPAVVGDATTLGWMGQSAGFSGNTWSFVLNDNEPGDNRSATGRILFIGGPSLPSSFIFNDGFE